MNIEALARPDIVAMKPYSSARKEAPGQGILLNANEAPRPLLTEPDAGTGLNRYPDPQPEQLVSKLARLYRLPESRLLVTRGSDEGIDLLTRVFCRAGQDAILHCPPTFGMYRIAAQTQGAEVISVPRSGDGAFRLDEQGILDALKSDKRIRLVFLTSPNNPTGDALNSPFLETLLEAASEQSLVIVDEAYAEFCSRPSAIALLDRFENLVVLRTLSKAWAAAGLRCGTVLAQPSVIDLLRRVIAPYPLPSPVVGLALRMLEPDMMTQQQELLEQMAANKAYLLDDLSGRRLVRKLLPGEANFILLRTKNPEDLLEFCARRNVILRGFPSDPLLRGYVRISVGSRADIDALSAVLDECENDNE